MERYVGLLCTAVIAFMWCIMFTNAQCGFAAFCCREDVMIGIFSTCVQSGVAQLLPRNTCSDLAD